MKVQEEILDQLEQMLYNYVEGHVDESKIELKEIFKFCVENQPEKPERSPAPQRKSCNFKLGDLVVFSGGPIEFVFLEKLPHGLCSVFNIESKKKVVVSDIGIELSKHKPIVLSAPELIAVLEEDGYRFEVIGRWFNPRGIPDSFDIKMLAFCGKEPGGDWGWNPRWLK